MKTVLEVLEATTGFFKKHGVESPRLNIEHLLAHVLGKRRMDLYLEFDRPLSERDLEPLRELVKRRGQGVPLQHLLGTVEFHRREFLCDARALIPRPETERFVELMLAEIPKEPAEGQPAPALLDLGTGTGVIALTLAAERPHARVVAVDLSPEALALARENAARLGLAERVEFASSDLFDAVPAGPFDVIAANLPYVPAGEIPGLAREVRHDPALALDGGVDGLAVIERAITGATAHLRPGGGRLALEIGHGHAAQAINLLLENDYRDIRAEKDYGGVERFLFARKG